MKKLMVKIVTFLLAGGLLCGAMVISGCDLSSDQKSEFAIETVALSVGYELRNGFEWTADVDRYYNAIMEGKLSIDAAKLAEGYLRERTHPLIANRLVRLAGMVGFDLNTAGNVVGVESVKIRLLQVAAQGFRQGLLLK